MAEASREPRRVDKRLRPQKRRDPVEKGLLFARRHRE
jgi:hypothetical protein